MTERERARLVFSGLADRDTERKLLDTMARLLAAMLDLQMGRCRLMAFPLDAWMTEARIAVAEARWVLRPALKRTPKRKSKKGAA